MNCISARHNSRARALSAIALIGSSALVVSGCATDTQPAEESGSTTNEVTIVVHDSFIDGAEFEAAASEATGYDVKVITSGDGGELTNKLVLTKGAPIADAFFGVDNTFASRLVENDVVAEVEPEGLPARAAAHQLDALVPSDIGATCVNIDTGWFAEKNIAEPVTYEDLTKPEYRDLTVLLDPTSSSTGASFMIGTIEAFGEDGFADYWKQLVDNGATVSQGWNEAYYEKFTAASESGTQPIVVSYSTSPAFTVNDDETESTTKALLDTCTTQVEYAGVLAGAANPEGAKALVEYMLSEEFQSIIPDEMYMYPIDESVALPATWETFAPLPAADKVHDLTPAEIESGREGWLKALAEAIGL